MVGTLSFHGAVAVAPGGSVLASVMVVTGVGSARAPSAATAVPRSALVVAHRCTFEICDADLFRVA